MKKRTLEELRHLTPSEISRMSEQEARRAFSALRTGFYKQLQRLEAAGHVREITSGTLPRLEQLPRDDVKTQLAEMAYWSRQGEYNAALIRKRLQGVQRWMKANKVPNPTYERAKQFAEFLGQLRDTGITSSGVKLWYKTAVEEARADMREAGKNVRYLADVMGIADTVKSQGGVDFVLALKRGIFGFNIEQATQHRKAIIKYAAELGEITQNVVEGAYTDKEIKNIIQRARRMHNRRR